MLPVTLPATLPGTAMREVALAFAGLRKEGFIHFNNAGKGIRVGVCTGLEKTVYTVPESVTLQANIPRKVPAALM
jgi:hypothetical protein